MKRILEILGLAIAISVMAEGLSEADSCRRRINKYVERANQFVQNNSLPRAKSEYLKALKIFPRHVDALYNLAIVCEKLGQKDEAVAHYKRYLEIRPNDADVWTQLGVLYDESDNKTEAKAAYEKALTIDPNFGNAHHNLGVLLKEQGKLPEAQQQFELFVTLEEKAGRRNGDAYYSLGTLYLARGRLRDAKHCVKGSRYRPQHFYYNNAMGDVYLAEKRSHRNRGLSEGARKTRSTLPRTVASAMRTGSKEIAPRPPNLTGRRLSCAVITPSSTTSSVYFTKEPSRLRR
jgi:Tfp pilus assembly protein PilF